jgi:hypothetical protein
MKRFALCACLVAGVAYAVPAAAQQPTPPVTDPAPAVRISDTLAVDVPAELQRTLDELAATLDRLGRRVANDPELRASAVRTAQTFVNVAQVMVVQQADVLAGMLKTIAERLADVAPEARR